MTEVSSYQNNGKKKGKLKVEDRIFAIEPNENVVFDTVTMQRAAQRQGTHAVKNRGAVRGGGRKPWKQKGTGRARQGSIRSPQWVGGGVVFGPTPHSYKYHLPKKVVNLAVKSVLSGKVSDDKLGIIDNLEFEKPSTKKFKDLLKNLKAEDQKMLVVLDNDDKEAKDASLSARNIPQIKLIKARNINALDLLNSDRVLMTKKSLSQVEEAL